MFSDIYEFIQPFRDFVIIAVLSLVIGIDKERVSHNEQINFFGTSRTFLFIGIFGYIFLAIKNYLLFGLGLISLVVFLALKYNRTIKKDDDYTLSPIILALIVYSLPILVVTQPFWFALFVYVVVIIANEMKDYFISLSKKMSAGESVTLGKFLFLTGVILPLAPKEQLSEYIPVSFYKIWLAVVVISGISYISYLLKKFVFPKASLMLTGILGGLYSSTASTFILSRKSKELKSSPHEYAASIIIATGMMFFRIYILMWIFNASLARETSLYFICLMLVTFVVGYVVYIKKKIIIQEEIKVDININPLEFKIAIIFALLYVFFSIVTNQTLLYFGNSGLNILSFIVGVTDIDPFLLNLFQGKFTASNTIIITSVFFAMMSNNIMKTIYSFVLAEKKTRRLVYLSMFVIITANIAVVTVFLILN